MIIKGKGWKNWCLVVLICIITLGCKVFAPSGSNPTPTETSGVLAGGWVDDDKNPCDGVTGNIELQILIGPSDAVGLEPYSVGEIPFSIVSEADSYRIEGGGPVEFYEEILSENWGTFTVKFDAQTVLSGTCIATDDYRTLNLTMLTTGEQVVEVRAEGFQSDYPWSGTPEIKVSLPLEEGSFVEGEGWSLILHLD